MHRIPGVRVDTGCPRGGVGAAAEPGELGKTNHIQCDCFPPGPELSTGEPVQLSAIKLEALRRPFPKPEDPEYAVRGYDVLGHVTRLPVVHISSAVSGGRVADPETVALLYAVAHEIQHGV